MMKKSNIEIPISMCSYSEGCQLKCVLTFEERRKPGFVIQGVNLAKRVMAKPWNLYMKGFLKKAYYSSQSVNKGNERSMLIDSFKNRTPLEAGDHVRVRSLVEIMKTLDPFMELKGCAFLEGMKKYCGTEQRVLKPLRYFIDERDYRRKKTRGLVLLDNIICEGTPVFGTCDRCCFLFWREEWLDFLSPGI